MRIDRFLAVLVGFLLIGFTSAGQAAGTLDKIRISKTISFGYRELAVPYSYVG